jgi:hypothetical protein
MGTRNESQQGERITVLWDGDETAYAVAVDVTREFDDGTLLGVTRSEDVDLTGVSVIIFPDGATLSVGDWQGPQPDMTDDDDIARYRWYDAAFPCVMLDGFPCRFLSPEGYNVFENAEV